MIDCVESKIHPVIIYNMKTFNCLVIIELFCHHSSAFTKHAPQTHDYYTSYLGNAKRRQFDKSAVLSSSVPQPMAASDGNIEIIKLPKEYSAQMIRNHFMDLALQQAEIAQEKGEVPIGAVIAGSFHHDAMLSEYSILPQINSTTNETVFYVLSKAHNLVEVSFDASAHAELLALRKGGRNIQNWRYPPNSTLYTTLEPCPICLSSAQAFRIDHVVFGAPDHRLGSVGSHVDLLSIRKHPFHEIKSVVGGIREDRCSNMLVDFFRERRKIAAARKKKRNSTQI